MKENDKKPCSRCYVEKGYKDFAVRQEYKDRTYIRGVCRTCYNERVRLKRASYKKQIFDHYGWKCVCCGESIVEFLTIDHTNNDAPQGFQTMCQNCNLGKLVNNGVCPHNRECKNSTMNNLLTGNYQEGIRMVPLNKEQVETLLVVPKGQ